jgi:S1-C subfamily serine protease
VPRSKSQQGDGYQDFIQTDAAVVRKFRWAAGEFKRRK